MGASKPQSPDDRLALLLSLSQTLNSSLDLDTVLNHLIDEVIQTMRAERGFVMLYDASGELTFRVARGMDQSTRNISQGMRNVPPSLVATIRGKRQMLPVPTAMLSMASIMPQREENVSCALFMRKICVCDHPFCLPEMSASMGGQKGEPVRNA